MFLSTFLIALVLGVAAVRADTGVLELDDKTFSKIVGRDYGVLVAFLEYSWKTPESFKEVAETFAEQADVLVAKVDTSNAEDAALKVAETPTLRWFAKGSASGVDFAGDAEDASEVTAFVHAQLSPQLQQLKQLAGQFVAASAAKRDELLAQASTLSEQLGESAQRTGKVIVATMKRVQERGSDFVRTESERLQKLVGSSSVAPNKIKDFKMRLATLRDFGAELAKKATGSADEL